MKVVPMPSLVNQTTLSFETVVPENRGKWGDTQLLILLAASLCIPGPTLSAVES